MTIFKLPGWAEAFAHKKWNHALVVVLRIVLGCIFIFSGFSKAIDPWGGYYKLIEYFNAYGFAELTPVALFTSFALAVFEFVLGLCLAVGAFRRGSVLLLLALICVMLPLTLDLALTGKVAQCGCFGDAVVITNWTTFWKNVLLLPALVYLLFFNRRVHGIYGPAVNWVVGVLGFLYISAIAYNGYFNQPLIDYRHYKVGYNIGVASDAAITDEDYVFIYEKDGVKQSFSIDELPDDDSGWEYVERRFKPGREPAPRVLNQGVVILDHGNEITEEVLPTEGRELMFLFPDLKNVNISYTFALNEINDHATRQGINVFAVTSADTADIAEWNDISMASYPMYNMDDSELKAIARGNPAVVMVNRGKIVWKRTLASLNEDWVRNAQFPVERFNDDYRGQEVLQWLNWLLLLCLAGLLVVNRTHVLILSFYRLFKKKTQKTPAGQETPQSPEVQEESAASSQE